MEDATRHHFFFHGPTKDGASVVKPECHWCQIRSFATHRALPITIVNETGDGAVIPRNFQFIDHTVLGEGVEAAAANFRSGCVCLDGAECMYSGCHCLGEMASSDDDDEDEGGGDDDEDDDKGDPLAAAVRKTGGRGAARHSRGRRKKFAYHSRGAKAGMLRSRVLDSREPIYECHHGCACGTDCPNRVVERGRTVPLQIFRTEDRGWGVRSLVEIKRGQFVDLYLGEIITADEAERRRAESNSARRKDVYLFALDKFSDPGSLDPRLAGAPLEVDGEYMSGPTRFINHSCEPNMRIFARVGDHADKHIHDLALFAIKDIPKGEELTFDYVDGLESMDTDARDLSLRDDMTPCLCKSRTCRGFLW